MADSTGKFGVGGLHHLGIPNRRQFFQLGAGAAAGWTLSGSAFAQTERPGNPPDKPRGQVIAALSQEPTVFHPLMPGIEVDQGVWWQVFSPLWFIDPDGKFVPDLAWARRSRSRSRCASARCRDSASRLLLQRAEIGVAGPHHGGASASSIRASRRCSSVAY